MEVSFVKFSPTQNVTVLVTDAVDRAAQPSVAAQLLAYDGVGGEQAGFLEQATMPGARARLQMMGGEFCGNATMSLGVFLAWKDNMKDGGTVDYLLEISGADEPVPCRITRSGDVWHGTVQMPLPEEISSVTVCSDNGEIRLPLVRLPGISHIIAPAETGLGREEIERRIRGWNEVVRADALGVLRWDEKSGEMEPIVYVPSTDSAVWERGCGSGTAALGCWRAWRERMTVKTAIRQPGGEIVVEAVRQEGKIVCLTITGCVKITAAGTAFLE